jgi:hypothetical protein
MTPAAPIPPELTGGLAETEDALAYAKALLPRGATGGHTFIAVWFFVWIVDAIRNRRHLRNIRERSSALGFPLDRHMVMLVTSDRLLVWKTGRRSPEVLGQVPRSEIIAAKLPYVGGSAWRTVELRLNSGYGIRFKIDGASAEGFVSALTSE